MNLRRHIAACALVAALAQGGCDVESSFAPATLAPLARDPGFAVVTSDYSSSAIAMLDPDGDLITEAWIDSGTRRPGLSSTIGGDVVLPTRAAPATLTVIDRLGVDVVTEIALPDARDIRQTHAQLSNDVDVTGYRANPQDYLRTPSFAMVTRFEPNYANDAPPLDRGNDLFFVDANGSPLRRLDLGLDIERDGERIYARPSRMVSLTSGVVVGIARLSRDFMKSAPGAVAFYDPQTDVVTYAALDGLENCGEVTAVADSENEVLVVCLGIPFGDDDARRMTSGLALVAASNDGALQVKALWRSSEHPDVAPVSLGAVSIGAGRVVVVASGDLVEGTPDQLLLLSLDDGSAQILHVPRGAFSLGYGARNPASGLVAVPDGRYGVQRFVPTPGGLERLTPTDTSPGRHLPAREVRWLSAE